MSNITVDIAAMVVTEDPEAVLVTHALGSCIAVAAWDPERHAAGMIHFMLPNSQSSPDRAAERPAMFADTGVPALFHALNALGCKKRHLVVRIAGGSALHDDRGVFDIGRRNHDMLRRMFARTRIQVAAEDVGGGHWRTMRLWAGSGRCVVTSADEELEL